ncbi:hypothetical protein [Huintestinicola sp.]|uniref:hypothetical protein n=1 Tax=Huintestinicola sp. TaxID=2981661 RepID=UPI003D7EE9F5
MTVKELCSNYNLKFQTVYKKITHHKDKELAGHITKVKGESIELDDFAVDFLLPTHVKVLQAIEECEGIARENAELQDKLESAETDAEQANEHLSKSLADNEKLLAEIDRLKSSLSEKDKEISELSEQLEAERRKSKQAIEECDKRINELTEENRLLTEKYEAIPKIFRKNQ